MKYTAKVDELFHHGILGMKWGVRRYQNYDGSLTPAGRERYGVAVQNVVDEAYGHREQSAKEIAGKIFDVVGANRKYIDEAYDGIQKDLVEQARITDEVEALFSTPDNTYPGGNRGLAISEIAATISEDGSGENTSMLDFAMAGSYGVLDDGGQEEINPFSLYTYEQGLENKVETLYNESAKSSKEAYDKAYDSFRTALNDVDYADVVINTRGPNKKNSTIGKKSVETYLSEHLQDEAIVGPGFRNYRGHETLDYAHPGCAFSERDKNSIFIADKYVSKLKNYDKVSTWSYIRLAIDNLGLDDKSLKDMSQSDWDDVNAEIERLENRRS